MKILFIRRNWSATGGAENYLVRLSKALQAADCRTELLCESLNGCRDAFDEILTLPLHGPNFLKPSRFSAQANHFVKKCDYDVVFSMERGIRADIYRAGDGVHACWLRHRLVERPVRGRLQNLCNFKNHLVLGLEQMTFHPQNTGWVIANSELVRNEIIRTFAFPESKIRIIPNGVDLSFFGGGNRDEGRAAMNWEKDEFVVLLVGAGAERKGHAVARQVSLLLKDPHRLHIQGGSAPCPMPDLYAAADVFLFPTLYDPFANVTLEAMAASLPVVTTATNGAAQVITQGQDGFVVRTSREISEMAAYVTALRDTAYRHRMGAAARATSSHYPLTRNAGETLALIRECAAAKQKCFPLDKPCL